MVVDWNLRMPVEGWTLFSSFLARSSNECLQPHELAQIQGRDVKHLGASEQKTPCTDARKPRSFTAYTWQPPLASSSWCSKWTIFRIVVRVVCSITAHSQGNACVDCSCSQAGQPLLAHSVCVCVCVRVRVRVREPINCKLSS